MAKPRTKRRCRICNIFIQMEHWVDHVRLHEDQLPLVDLAPLTVAIEKKSNSKKVAS